MNITLIGAGKMTQALLQAWQLSSVLDQHHITVSSPHHDQVSLLKKQYPVITTTNNQIAVVEADMVILAVRPQHLDTVIQEIKDHVDPKAWIFSLAAIGSLAWLETQLPHHKICRLIPSTAMSQRLGCLALSKNTLAEHTDFSTIQSLLDQLGTVLTMEEKHLDAFITISASGLAYVYLMMKLFQTSAENVGLPTDLAHQVVPSVFQAAAHMAKEGSYETLISKVATPGGTTEAGLQAFDQESFQANIDQVFAATLNKINQLTQDFDADESNL